MTLLLIVVSAAVSAGLATATFAQEKTPPAATSNATMTTSDLSVLNVTEPPFFGFERSMMLGEAFEGLKGRHCGFGGPIGYFEVSAEYNQTVNNILDQDTDVQNLISQGYNITFVRPILSSTIGANGTVITNASSAIVTLQNGISGLAIVKVDVTNAEVSEIVVLTRTVINKSSS